MFSPFRALGHITSNVPLAIQPRGKTYFLTSSIGHTFQIYDAEKMNLLFVGNQHLQDISGLATYKYQTLVSSGNIIYVFERAKLVYEFEVDHPVTFMLVLGHLLFVLDESSLLSIWNLETESLENELQLSNATSLYHPSTYVNKILVACTDGVELWNISSMKRLYKFESFGLVSCMVQAPTIDVIAFGTTDGSIVLKNIKTDKELFRFHQEGQVTGISFRTTNDEQYTMATVSSLGDITLWDLKEKRVAYRMKDAHDASIHTCFFFSGLPILLTASADNSIKQWSFESVDSVPRLLRFRTGHHKPPHKIRFYGKDGQMILSAGQDQSLFSFSIIRDAQHVELSQGSLKKKAANWNTHIDKLKLPCIVDFASNNIGREWDDIVTCHSDPIARTWSFSKKVMGNHELKSSDGQKILSTVITSCGHYAFVGTSGGRIDKFNLQSGLYRSSCEFSEPIQTLSVDHLNRWIVSGTASGIQFWDFKKHQLLHTLDLGNVLLLKNYFESGLLMVVTVDAIQLLDVENFKVVRLFNTKATDADFSPDGRWIVSCYESTVKVWDIPTGYMIDGFKVPNNITSIAFSPKGDFVATTHQDQLGIYLWANCTMYSYIDIKPISLSQIRDYSLPGVEAEPVEMVQDIQVPEIEHVDDELIQISDLPKSKWQNLLNLEAIKQRNKPKEKPTAPKVNFFLSEYEKEQKPRTEERIVKDMDMAGSMDEMLEKSFDEWFNYMMNLSPSQTDLEIRLVTNHSRFLEHLDSQMKTLQNLDLCMAYLNVFLKVHGTALTQVEQLSSIRQQLSTIQTHLEKPLFSCLGLLSFMTNA